VINPGPLVKRPNAAKSEKVIDHPLKPGCGRMFGSHRRVSSVFDCYRQDAEALLVYGGQVHAIDLSPQAEKRPRARREIVESIAPSGFINIHALPA
jgi:hypothetical protein